MLNENEKAILWLSTCDYISTKKQYQILQSINEPINLINCLDKFKSELVSIVGLDNYNKMELTNDISDINNYILNLEKQNIGVTTIVSSNYSKLLSTIDSPPIALYFRGNIDLLNYESVAVVGTRRISRYGIDVTKTFSSALSKSGVTIVSGLADGVDTVAQTESLNSGGKVIAVLGCGLNEIYPASNTNLAERIIKENGLIISEYKPNEKPRVYYFPMRNRIIAGLSKAVLITEATEKSGTMHTKNFALEYGREVFAVPGRITDIYSSGCNKIIKNCQSAIALSPNDILEFLGKKFVESKKDVVQLGLVDELILGIIDVNEVHYEEILSKSNVDSKTLNTTLIRLELKGLIKKLSGNYYSK